MVALRSSLGTPLFALFIGLLALAFVAIFDAFVSTTAHRSITRQTTAEWYWNYSNINENTRNHKLIKSYVDYKESSCAARAFQSKILRWASHTVDKSRPNDNCAKLYVRKDDGDDKAYCKPVVQYHNPLEDTPRRLHIHSAARRKRLAGKSCSSQCGISYRNDAWLQVKSSYNFNKIKFFHENSPQLKNLLQAAWHKCSISMQQSTLHLCFPQFLNFWHFFLHLKSLSLVSFLQGIFSSILPHRHFTSVVFLQTQPPEWHFVWQTWGALRGPHFSGLLQFDLHVGISSRQLVLCPSIKSVFPQGHVLINSKDNWQLLQSPSWQTSKQLWLLQLSFLSQTFEHEYCLLELLVTQQTTSFDCFSQ